MVLITNITLSQTTLTEAEVKTKWGTGQMPKGLNLTNTWYTVFNKIPNYIWNSGQLVNADLNQKNITNINKVGADTIQGVSDLQIKAVDDIELETGTVSGNDIRVVTNDFQVAAYGDVRLNIVDSLYVTASDVIIAASDTAKVSATTRIILDSPILQITGTATAPTVSITTSGVVTYTLSSSDSTTSIPNTRWVKQRLSSISSPFTDGGAFTYLTSTTDLFQVGSSSSLGASLGSKGQGATSGTINLLGQNSAGAQLYKFQDDGRFALGYNASVTTLTGIAIGYTAKSGSGEGISIGNNAGGTSASAGGVLIGTNAGQTQTASELVMIGFNAGGSSTGGNYNIGLGGYVMSTLTTGLENISIGRYGLYGVTTGANNVHIGGDIQTMGATASRNTILGHSAGAIANNGVSIGYKAGRYETASNKVYIDMLDRTDEATGRTSSLIYGVGSATLTSQILTINAVIQAHQYTATEGSAITPVNGMLIYVNSTNGTFTSVGIWAYENAAWVKL